MAKPLPRLVHSRGPSRFDDAGPRLGAPTSTRSLAIRVSDWRLLPPQVSLPWRINVREPSGLTGRLSQHGLPPRTRQGPRSVSAIFSGSPPYDPAGFAVTGRRMPGAVGVSVMARLPKCFPLPGGAVASVPRQRWFSVHQLDFPSERTRSASPHPPPPVPTRGSPAGPVLFYVWAAKIFIHI